MLKAFFIGCFLHQRLDWCWDFTSWLVCLKFLINFTLSPLGLSWLIGGSLQEVLTSIIFLFIKHPFDVGDRVIISKEGYTVKEIRLLSTIFLDGHGVLIQAPNNQLNTLVRRIQLFLFFLVSPLSIQFIHNIRRSPQVSSNSP